MAVLVLDRSKQPLMPCSEKRGRLLLERGRARVHRMVPFTIRLVDRRVEDSVLQPIRLKRDPGSQTTGLALVREREAVDQAAGEILRAGVVLTLLEAQHRGSVIRERLTARRAFRFCTLIQGADGYGYSLTKRAFDKGDAGTGAACAAALSLPGLMGHTAHNDAGVSRAIG